MKLRVNATTSLILINVAVYVFMALHGGASENDPYYLAGVLYGPFVLQHGEWYRIVTSAFMHAGIPHIALNMFALYQLGSFVETMLGGWRMLVVYAISLVGGGLAVVYFSPNDATVGASGAIFGLFGTLFAIGLRMGKPGRDLISRTLPVLALNLVFTFAIPSISKAGHVGGLLSGFAAGLVFYAMRRRPPSALVLDSATGESSEAELLPPERPETQTSQSPA
ncbi:MAG: rhomboid family intramembrane serine protease [Candidatus Eremiobacteraeota bacterium]|nr:rhomboid family intramembrane serine protease [Candidatus Eremiobacteraeota bacterium]